MTPDYDYEAQTSYTLQLFCCFFDLMFVLCYWYDQKTGIAFTGSYIISFKVEFGHVQISVPKIGKPMPKTACSNPWIVYHNTTISLI